MRNFIISHPIRERHLLLPPHPTLSALTLLTSPRGNKSKPEMPNLLCWTASHNSSPPTTHTHTHIYIHTQRHAHITLNCCLSQNPLFIPLNITHGLFNTTPQSAVVWFVRSVSYTHPKTTISDYLSVIC